MLLILGRPVSACSTPLKVLASHRFGYESVDEDVTYGGTDAKAVGKGHCGTIIRFQMIKQIRNRLEDRTHALQSISQQGHVDPITSRREEA